MPTLRLVASAALAVLLLAPLGAAASGRGDLTMGAPALLPGSVSMDAPTAYLRWTGDAAPALDLAAAELTLHFYGTNKTTQPVPVLGNVAYKSDTIGGTAHHTAARVALKADGVDALLGLQNVGTTTIQTAEATLAADEGAFIASVLSTDTHCDPADCIGAAGVYQLASAGSTSALRGELTFILHGPTLIVADKDGETRYPTGTHASQDTGTMTTTTDTWIVATLHSAEGTLATNGPTTWFAPTPTITATALRTDTAAGTLAIGARHYAAAQEPLDLAGALTITGAPIPQGKYESATKPKTAPEYTLHVAGDVQTVNLRATPIYQDTPAQAVGLAAILALAAALVAYSWQHLTYAAAALYTRLKQPTILDNEVRNSIYEIIRTNPGISARAVHRQSAQSWGTVVYHLRQLERHQLVVSRSVGRTRNYYENHGKYRGMEVQLACLQSPRARTLARLVLAQPGITQEELVEKSEFPQPTTSYYVRKLKASSLVEERREGRYARYHPLGELARFLELADASSTPTVGITDGVQA